MCAVFSCPGEAEVPDPSDPLGQVDGHDSPIPTLKGKLRSVLLMQVSDGVFRVPYTEANNDSPLLLKAWSVALMAGVPCG